MVHGLFEGLGPGQCVLGIEDVLVDDVAFDPQRWDIQLLKQEVLYRSEVGTGGSAGDKRMQEKAVGAVASGIIEIT